MKLGSLGRNYPRDKIWSLAHLQPNGSEIGPWAGPDSAHCHLTDAVMPNSRCRSPHADLPPTNHFPFKRCVSSISKFRYWSDLCSQFNQSNSRIYTIVCIPRKFFWLDIIFWMLRKWKKILNRRFFIQGSRIQKMALYLKIVWLFGVIDLICFFSIVFVCFGFLAAKKVGEVT